MGTLLRALPLLLRDICARARARVAMLEKALDVRAFEHLDDARARARVQRCDGGGNGDEASGGDDDDKRRRRATTTSNDERLERSGF